MLNLIFISFIFFTLPLQAAYINSVTVTSGNITAAQGSPPWTFSLPTGASTAALQTTGNASLASIDTKLTSPLVVTGPLTDTQLRASAVSVSVSNFPASQAVTGTFFQATQPISAASLPLPSGASTSALQTTGNTSLSSIDTKLTSPLTVTGPLTDTQLRASAVSVSVSNFPATQPVSASSLPLPTGAATAANQATANTSLSSIDSKLSSPITVSGAISISGATGISGATANTSLTATTASTATAPTNAIGFIVEAPDSNTDNIRYRVGGAASTTLGMSLQPGRDSGFVPVKADVSVCATVSGTNAFEIQWIISQ